MVAHNPAPSHGGNVSCLPGGDAYSSVFFLMCAETINLTTRDTIYESFPNKTGVGEAMDQLSSSTPHLDNDSLHNERLVSNLVSLPPKSTFHKVTFNPSSFST